MSRAVRLPFGFRQKVRHDSFPNLTFTVIAQEVTEDGQWSISVTDPTGGGWWTFAACELTYASLEDEQQQMAEWLGCSVEQMNARHDKLHCWLAEWAGQPSYSMMVADGKALTDEQRHLAAVEEDAVLAVQRYLCAIDSPLKEAA